MVDGLLSFGKNGVSLSCSRVVVLLRYTIGLPKERTLRMPRSVGGEQDSRTKQRLACWTRNVNDDFHPLIDAATSVIIPYFHAVNPCIALLRALAKVPSTCRNVLAQAYHSFRLVQYQVWYLTQ